MHVQNFIPSLTSIRGIAALWVVFFHIHLTYKENLFFSFFENGDLGVDIFFVLSGFIMSFVYGETNFRESNFKKFYGEFIGARVSRVYPLHLFTLLFLLLVVFILPGFRERYDADYFNLTTFVANIFLVQNWGITNVGWNAVSWSISAEWFMYLLFPLMLYLRQKITTKYNLYIFSFIIILSHYSFIYIFDLSGYGGISLGGMVRVFFEFSLGFSLYFIKDDFKKLFLRAHGYIIFIAIATMLLSSAIKPLWYLFLPSTAILILHLGTVDCRVSRILSQRVFLYFGNISFSLYMWHWIVINIQNWMGYKNIITLQSNVSIYISCFMMLAISITIAHYSYLYIEIPARKWGRKLLN